MKRLVVTCRSTTHFFGRWAELLEGIMIRVPAYAAKSAGVPLQPFEIERRTPGPRDVVVDIHFCGVCHSDIHQARDEWGGSEFPMVPGHEIVGKVEQVGTAVKKFKVGDPVGVGCMVNSCRTCGSCKEGFEQYCEVGVNWTYNSTERDGVTRTHGGYSTKIVVDEDFVLTISPKLSLAHAAPLLCAGITTYSPLRHWEVGRGQRVGILGLGGLGHMAVKLASAMGAEVIVFSSSDKKREDSLRMGAVEHIATKDPENLKRFSKYFQLIVNTVSAPHNLPQYLDLLKRDGTMVVVGIPETPEALPAMPLISKRRSISGSLIGGVRETQEMLDFCGENGIASDVEVIPIQGINEAYARIIRGDVRYRFVIDLNSLR